jgi:hypothetical protein
LKLVTRVEWRGRRGSSCEMLTGCRGGICPHGPCTYRAAYGSGGGSVAQWASRSSCAFFLEAPRRRPSALTQSVPFSPSSSSLAPFSATSRSRERNEPSFAEPLAPEAARGVGGGRRAGGTGGPFIHPRIPGTRARACLRACPRLRWRACLLVRRINAPLAAAALSDARDSLTV